MRLLRLGGLLLGSAFFASVAPVSSARAVTPALEALQTTARELRIANSRRWHLLLHYRERSPGFLNRGVRSEIDDPLFFTSPEGRWNAQAELEATLLAFTEPPKPPTPVRNSDQAERIDPESQHPQCRFIDRYHYLKEVLPGFDAAIPPQPCSDFEQWRKVHDPASITLVFASYYMGNPSSMFGHTLLRLNSRRHKDGAERILDYGANYAAHQTSQNPFIYSILGLFGGFKGDYSNVLYYLKLQEYGDIESRDIWEYDLKFTPAEINRLLDHLWSVGHVRPSYYFLDANCSYQILTLLEAAKPEWHLTEKFPLVVIPVDTLRAIPSDAFGTIAWRPSLVTRLREMRQDLRKRNPQLESAFLTWGSALLKAQPFGATERTQLSEELKALPDADRALLLDAWIELSQYARMQARNLPTADQIAFQSELRALRSDITIPVAQPAGARVLTSASPERPPHEGHNTWRIGVGGGYSEVDGAFIEPQARVAFHDLNANPIGFPPGSQVEIVDLRLRIAQRRASLERLTILSAKALAPVERLFGKWSWSSEFQLRNPRDDATVGGIELATHYAMGGNWEIVPGVLRVFALPKIELTTSPAYNPGFRIGPGAWAGIQWLPTPNASLLIQGSGFYSVWGLRAPHLSATAEMRLSLTQHADVRLAVEQFWRDREARLQLYVQF